MVPSTDLTLLEQGFIFVAFLSQVYKALYSRLGGYLPIEDASLPIEKVHFTLANRK